MGVVVATLKAAAAKAALRANNAALRYGEEAGWRSDKKFGSEVVAAVNKFWSAPSGA